MTDIETLDPAAEAQTLCQFLQQHQIDYEHFHHPAAHTVKDAIQHTRHIDGAHCKNLFLKSRKDVYWVITIPADAMIDLPKLAQILDEPKISMGHPTRMAEFLRVKPGAVTPLAAIHDHEQKVRLVFDEQLLAAEQICFPPLDNTQTVRLSKGALEQFSERAKHPIQWIDIPRTA